MFCFFSAEKPCDEVCKNVFFSLFVCSSSPDFSSWRGLFPGSPVRRLTGVQRGRGVAAGRAWLGARIHSSLLLHGSTVAGLESDMGADRCTAAVSAGGGALALHRLSEGRNGWEQLCRCSGPGWDSRVGAAGSGCRGLRSDPLPEGFCRGKLQGGSPRPPQQAAAEWLPVCGVRGNMLPSSASVLIFSDKTCPAFTIYFQISMLKVKPTNQTSNQTNRFIKLLQMNKYFLNIMSK